MLHSVYNALQSFVENNTEDSDIATTSLASEQASDRLSEPLNKEIQAKINHYESLLKRVSKKDAVC